MDINDKDLLDIFSDPKYAEKIDAIIGKRISDSMIDKDKEIATLKTMNATLYEKVQAIPKTKEDEKIPDDFIGFASKPYSERMTILRKHAYDGIKSG